MTKTENVVRDIDWEWANVDWRKVQTTVFRLQKRIYKASRCGNVRKVRKLQKTLMRSWSAKVLAVRQVSQDNRGKKTAGVDGVKSLSREARVKLVGQLKLTGKSKATRRVWIPKPGKTEKRPLGIPTMYDRALQALVKLALEPEWEAKFEPSSYGFRPGRSCQDAIKHIKDAVKGAEKYVLDADIAKCFDRINHNALLDKTGYKGLLRQQIKAWLKSGVLDQGVFSKTEMGTPQGGVISPLLANIALDGIERMLKKYAENAKGWKSPGGHNLSREGRVWSLTFVRYADDFVVLHRNKEVVLECKELISSWLLDIGLELKPEKTRLAHTVYPERSEDGEAGFNFLGFHIRGYEMSKHKCARNTKSVPLGWRVLIHPTKEKIANHMKGIERVIKALRKAPQAALIKELNPKIRGWRQYYRHSDTKSMGILSKCDSMLYEKLRGWAVSKGSKENFYKKYWQKIDGRKVFSTREGEVRYKLETYNPKGEHHSSVDYIKVRGDKSPYDGDWKYWATRRGQYPETPNKVAKLLQRQKGRCTWCGLYFKDGDILEVDHIKPKSKGGGHGLKNLQLLHGHCHDEKTKQDQKRWLKEYIEEGHWN
ncbi:MAG: group II intron reverse transcriptase/maturase [Gloeocapsa sp. DLM2.Bin57]|nr:MAG: group II intron reverse transcriptase/maturase [Gloeocapsa sp. DLM2.Bin57]